MEIRFANANYFKDILQFTDSSYKGEKIYFSHKYNHMQDGFAQLKNDLQVAAKKNGSDIISCSKKRGVRYFRCKHSLIYQPKLKTENKRNKFCVTTLISVLRMLSFNICKDKMQITVFYTIAVGQMS